MIIQNTDLEAITESGGRRQQANTIRVSDTSKFTDQKSFIFLQELNTKLLYSTEG